MSELQYPRIHKREAIVKEARRKLEVLMFEIEEKLTLGEMLRVVGEVLGGYLTLTAKYVICEERHGNTDTPGGLES